MRPSMRLPLREALYVCSICKSEATPRRVSPLVRQIRRYASDSPSVLERTRRSLWKGDKPPGQADPYSGGSQIASKDGGYAGELAAGVEGEEFKLGDQYVQAETWDGLRRIGFTEEEAWKERGSNGADKYSRFGADITPKPIPAAAHQAAVEIALMAMLGKPLDSVSQVGEHYPQIQELIDACGVESSETQQWSTALRFPDERALQALEYVFNQIGGQTKNQIKSPENFIAKEKTSAEPPRDLSLVDPRVKFAFVKRFSQLIGRRIPDAAITSSTTVGEIIVSLSTTLKEKPINVGKKLAKQRRIGVLPPNIQFSTSRMTRGQQDEDMGRKKAIYAELIRRGLIFPKEETRSEDKEEEAVQHTEAQSSHKSSPGPWGLLADGAASL